MTRGIHITGRAAIAAAMVAGLPAALSHALPPHTNDFLYQSGYNVSGVGLVNSPFFTGGNGGEGFKGLAINNAGASFVHVGIHANPGFNQAVLASGLAPTPFLASGVEFPFAGSVTVPSTEYVLDVVYGTAMNNLGTAAFLLRLGPGEFSAVDPITGVYFNNTAMPIREGDPVTAAGVSPGTTFAAFGGWGCVYITDANVLLLGCRIIEGGETRNALLKVQLDGSGNPMAQTLVAKEGGPAGAGPETWATLAIGSQSCAINNAGSVVYSGRTSGGQSRVYRDQTLLAQQGGASPAAGMPWGELSGAPVDINASGQYALRAPVIGGDGWIEQGDAGETFTSGGGGTTGNVTLGGGPLELITGQLTNDHDVDVYYITVGDPALPAQEPFSVTTVPDPGSGFAGAGFDTVLYLFRDFANANGAFRVGVGRCDDVAPGVPQSTLTAASLTSGHVPGTRYFLAISTPRSRALTPPTATPLQMWQDDPGVLAVAGGTVFWVDPSEGQILGASATTGAPITPLQVGVIPPHTIGQIAEDAPLLSSLILAHDAGANSKLFFLEKRFFPWRLKRCNLDGSAVETIRTSSDPGPSIGALLASAIDSVNGRIWWSRPEENGTINACDLDGGNPQTLLILESTRATSLAVDGTGGKVYWHEPVANSFNRANLDGTGFQILGLGLGVRSLAADVPGRTLYLSMTSGAIRRYNLDTGAFISDLLSSNAATGMTVDPGAGKLYWTNGAERMIRRSDTGAPAVEDWLSVGPDVGERPADGPGYLNSFHSWQRAGAPGAGVLPYQIKLTGATFANQVAVLARGNTKVALAGEVLASTSPDPVTSVGGLNSPVRISDNGVVAWRGRWTSTVAGQTGTRTALFLNNEEVFRDNQPPTGGGVVLGAMTAERDGLDMSPSGQYVLADTFNGAFAGGAGDRCVLVTFATPPGCRADFNGDGVVSVPDIFAFLSAWFAGSAAADFDNSGTLGVPDIFAFLSAWFAGCT